MPDADYLAKLFFLLKAAEADLRHSVMSIGTSPGVHEASEIVDGFQTLDALREIIRQESRTKRSAADDSDPSNDPEWGAF